MSTFSYTFINIHVSQIAAGRRERNPLYILGAVCCLLLVVHIRIIV